MSDLLLDPDDLFLFNEGSHRHLHRVLGAQPVPEGTRFAVWAPNAREVGVVGDFDGWGRGSHRLEPQGTSGIWAATVAAAAPGDLYRYRIVTGEGALIEKTDPVAAAYEEPPATAAVDRRSRPRVGRQRVDGVTGHDDRPRRAGLDLRGRTSGRGAAPLPAATTAFPGYREIATSLAEHVLAHGFTHVELLPIMEHPFYGSWGYQTTGYFAPTSRYGSPTDFMALVDHLHQEGVGVILDWVPSHFPTDPFALARFDGTHLYEHADPRLGWHPDWDSAIFNYGRHEVRSFLVSSAICWLERYHADGLRVDAVASMLYRDYSRRRGRVAPERVRRQGEPRGDRLPERPERGRLRRAPRRRDLRRGVDGVADGEQADVHRRAGVRLQVGHGVDARHPAVLLRGSRAPALAPPRADVPLRVRLQRELHPAPLPRRGRPRQGLAARQDAR